MKKAIFAVALSAALVGGANFALAAQGGVDQSIAPWSKSTQSFKVSQLLPKLKNLTGSKTRSDIIKVCNDSKMACIAGVDTCCSTGKACPSDGVCP